LGAYGERWVRAQRGVETKAETPKVVMVMAKFRTKIRKRGAEGYKASWRARNHQLSKIRAWESCPKLLLSHYPALFADNNMDVIPIRS